MIVGIALVGFGIVLIVTGGVLLMNARWVGDRIRPRHMGYDRLHRRFVAENMDLIAAGIIMVGLYAGVRGGLKIADVAYALPQTGGAVSGLHHPAGPDRPEGEKRGAGGASLTD